jgi:hypothetical protein
MQDNHVDGLFFPQETKEIGLPATTTVPAIRNADRAVASSCPFIRIVYKSGAVAT